MSYPTIPGIWRCQVVWQGESGLPTDVYVNNWYFKRSATPVGDLDLGITELEGHIFSFYEDQPTAGGTTRVAQFMSKAISGLTFKWYDIGAAPPRYPYREEEATALPVWGTSQTYPGEVALCLSFAGGRGRRERGRWFIGPLNESAGGDVLGGSRPVDGLREALLWGAEDLYNEINQGAGEMADWSWVVVSPTGGSYVDVDRAWVDDTFDTQRSRGLEESARFTLTLGDGQINGA